MEELAEAQELKPEVDESYSVHSQDYQDVISFLNSTVEIISQQHGREDMLIQISLLEQYMHFWKSRFDSRQDYLLSYETDPYDEHNNLDEAHQGLHLVPLQFVKDWMEVPHVVWKELFKSSDLNAIYFRCLLA